MKLQTIELWESETIRRVCELCFVIVAALFVGKDSVVRPSITTLLVSYPWQALASMQLLLIIGLLTWIHRLRYPRSEYGIRWTTKNEPLCPRCLRPEMRYTPALKPGDFSTFGCVHCTDQGQTVVFSLYDNSKNGIPITLDEIEAIFAARNKR